MARGEALSMRPFAMRRDRLRLDVRISQLTNGMPDGRISDRAWHHRAISIYPPPPPCWSRIPILEAAAGPECVSLVQGTDNPRKNGVRSTVALALKFWVESLVQPPRNVYVLRMRNGKS